MSIKDLSDVSDDVPSVNQVLGWNGSEWKPDNAGGARSNINGIVGQRIGGNTTHDRAAECNQWTSTSMEWQRVETGNRQRWRWRQLGNAECCCEFIIDWPLHRRTSPELQQPVHQRKRIKI